MLNKFDTSVLSTLLQLKDDQLMQVLQIVCDMFAENKTYPEKCVHSLMRYMCARNVHNMGYRESDMYTQDSKTVITITVNTQQTFSEDASMQESPTKANLTIARLLLDKMIREQGD